MKQCEKNKYNNNRSKIREILKEKGVYKSKGNYGIKYNWSKENIDLIIKMYKEDRLSAEVISQKYNCYDTTILDILNKNGIDTKRKRETHNFTKYNVQKDYFTIIDTEEKSYWLGFLLADGHVTKDGKIILALQSKDYSHLEKYVNSLSSNHPISLHKTYGTYNVTIGCKELNQSLWDKGFNNRKSWDYDVEEIVSHIPDELMNHFIRGYFDGDGCVGIYNQGNGNNGKMHHISILGVKSLLEFIKCYVPISCQIKHDTRTVNTYQLISRSKKEIIKFKEFLYNNANIFMNRKHDIFEEII